MPTLQELRLQIDKGKTALLSFKDEDEDEEIELRIRRNKQSVYTSTFSYPNRPNPFPQPQVQLHSSWDDMLVDIGDVRATSDQWDIK